MEVDMIGGKMVGPIDIVFQKHSIQSNIPPGFSSKLRGQWEQEDHQFGLNFFICNWLVWVLFKNLAVDMKDVTQV